MRQNIQKLVVTPKKLVLCMLAAISMQLNAQVGINTAVPNPLTSLDVENAQMTSDPRGIIIPRMSTIQRDAIDLTKDIDTNGQGLMIYNIDEECFDYYDKTNSKWQSLCGGMSKVVATVNCNDVSSFGFYFAGVPLSASNYLNIVFNVSTPGMYSVVGTPETPNGYYFSASGQILAPGTYTLLVPAIGTPKVAGVDVIDLSLNGVPINSSCPSINISVKNQSLLYNLACGAVISGTYTVGQALNGNNLILLNLINIDPSAAGSAYDIQATVANDPGFSFRGQGILGSASTQQVVLYGKGVPTLVQTGAVVTITSNSTMATGATQCTDNTLNINAQPGYQIDPASIAATTTYLAGTAVNKLSLDVTFSAIDAGDAYFIQTNEINGVSYSATGVLGLTSPQTINLEAKGAAINLGQYTFNISSNSSATSGTTATANVLMANKQLSVLAIGSNTDYTLFNTPVGGQSAFITNTSNFDLVYDATPGSKKYYQDGWNVTWEGNVDETTLTNEINVRKPDIITIGWGWGKCNKAIGTVIRNYLISGGIVLCFLEDNSQGFLRGVLNNTNINVSNVGGAGTKGSVYQFANNLSKDPIINGLYGDLSNQYWGDDNGPTQAATNLPPNVIVYTIGPDISNNKGNANQVSGFRMSDEDFVYFGDGGFGGSQSDGNGGYQWGSYSGQNGGNTSMPCWFDTNSFPVTKPNYGGGSSFTVSNSILFANFMVAAADRARAKGFPISGVN